VVRKEKFCLLF